MRGGKSEDHPNLCDFCNKSEPILYCRADSARLCLSCDRHVHLANAVSSKHSRSLLCNSCSSAPSSILCSSHGRVLCSNCDFEAHDDSTTHHERRPVEWFCGCPGGLELGLALGFGGNEELLLKEEERTDFDERVGEIVNDGSWVWETPRFVRLDELIGDPSNHGLKAMGVPPLPKNRNLACGEQKEEILQQLRELIRSENQLSTNCEEADPVTEFPFPLPENNDQQGNFHSNIDVNATFTVTPNYESSELQWNSDHWHNATDPLEFPCDQQPVSVSGVTSSFPDGVSDFHTSACPDRVSYFHVSACPTASSNGDALHHIVGGSLPPSTPKLGLEILCPDRDSVITRYKEKRKTRRFDKLIRYESRKARADSRVRIKGRFAKVDGMPKC